MIRIEQTLMTLFVNIDYYYYFDHSMGKKTIEKHFFTNINIKDIFGEFIRNKCLRTQGFFKY